MYLHKSTTEGIYKPTLFHLSINKKYVLNGNNQIKEEYDHIFFHEYIHFLQDILTSFGLRNISKLVRKFSIINHEILGSTQPDFQVPYVSNNDSLKHELELFNLIWGTEELGNNDRDFEVVNIELVPCIYNPALAGYNLVSVNIIYRDNLDQDAFYIGAIHFMECIAHILERNLDFSANPTPFPYKVIEKIIKSVFQPGDFSDLNILLIAEAALESHDPANYFHTFYEFCENQGYTFSKDAIGSFKNVYRQTWDGRSYKYENFYYPNASMAKHAFNAMFNHEHLQSLNKWSKLLLSNAVKIRRAGFSFTDLLTKNGNTNVVKQNVSRLVKRLGTPIMSDQKYGIFLRSPDNKISEDEMLQLLGLEAVLNILEGDTICSIVPYCANGQGGADITDAQCYTSPWEKTKKIPYCILAQFWIMWGFVNKGTKK